MTRFYDPAALKRLRTYQNFFDADPNRDWPRGISIENSLIVHDETGAYSLTGNARTGITETPVELDPEAATKVPFAPKASEHEDFLLHADPDTLPKVSDPAPAPAPTA